MINLQAWPAAATVEAERASVRSPGLLQIRDGGGISFGAHQIWYSSWIGKMGGCGPTAASNLLWYLAASRPEACGRLFDGDGGSRAGMLRLMETVWKYVTPGMRGVDKPATLADGAVRFGAERGVALGARVFEVPADPAARPTKGEALDFLTAAFSDDLPVAFLNLSNGRVRNLDNWHWVTLVAVDGALLAEMYDQSRRLTVDLSLWLDSTKGGGAFVAVEPLAGQTKPKGGGD